MPVRLLYGIALCTSNDSRVESATRAIASKLPDSSRLVFEKSFLLALPVGVVERSMPRNVLRHGTPATLTGRASKNRELLHKIF
jgi:hypothetical protein